ncbi:MAG: hypothetical protein IH596_02140 [Bacteroidales bacterium]|nr:hypothetical protein [Bacteroidales bacterium]
MKNNRSAGLIVYVKGTFLVVILLLLVSPVIQQVSSVFSTSLLHGYFEMHAYPPVSLQRWHTGQYQTECELAMKDHTGFRSDLVRLYNQVDFSLFAIPHAEKIIIGKGGYLMASQYIDAWLGLDFKGRPYIREKVRKFVQLQDLLWQNEQKLLILVFPPDKGTFYSEYIPDRYLKKIREETNYRAYVEELSGTGANFIDFNSYFMQLKEKSPYILYPKTGIHWSNFGALLAADSLTHYIESSLGTHLPAIMIDSVVETTELRDPDGDIENTLNLIWKISHPTMAYPAFHFDTTGKKRINALIVGDSFYWNWYNSGFIKNTFGNEDFWYYNRDAYPQHFTSPTSIWDIDRKEAITRADVIVILLVNAGYGNIGYGFLEELASYLGMEDPQVEKILVQMRNTPKWLEALEKKAKERGIPLNEMMVIDARYLLEERFVE